MSVGDPGESTLVLEPPEPELVVRTAAAALASPPPTGRVLALLTETPAETWRRTWAEAGYPATAADHVTFRGDLEADGGERGPEMPLVALSLELAGRFDWLASGDTGVVSIDHLAPLVATAGRERAFRFVHIVASHARSNGHRLVAHADPDRTDRYTRQLLVQGFDNVLPRRTGGR